MRAGSWAFEIYGGFGGVEVRSWISIVLLERLLCRLWDPYTMVRIRAFRADMD